MFRLSRIRGKVSYATKAEHDFHRPADFDPRAYANRADWQLGDERGRRRDPDLRADRLADRTPLRPLRRDRSTRPTREDDERRGAARGRRQRLRDDLLEPAQPHLVGARARRQRAAAGPARARRASCERRLELLRERHERDAAGEPRRARLAAAEARRPAAAPRSRRAPSRRARGRGRRGEAGPAEAAIRPERFARLVTLASILIEAGRAGERVVDRRTICERLQLSEEELREDVNVLNVVNFGGGSYVLYAEINEEEGEIEVDPEPYSDNFDRPARLLPVEAKALVAAIDLIGEHIPEGSLTSAREKIVAALGEDPMEQGLQVAPRGGDDSDVARPVSKAITGTAPDRARVLQGERGRDLAAQGRAVRAHQRPRGLVRGLVRPRARRRAPLPPRPHQERDRQRRELPAAPRGRPRRRGRRLAAHRRGGGLAQRARVGLARARALGARGAARGRGARRRRR